MLQKNQYMLRIINKKGEIVIDAIESIKVTHRVQVRLADTHDAWCDIEREGQSCN